MTALAASGSHNNTDAPGIVARVVQFARLLRDNGFCIGPHEIADALSALAATGIPTVRGLRVNLRVLFCHRRAELDRFDEIFDAYWLKRARFKRTVLREVRAGQSRGTDGRESTAAHGGGLARYFDWATSGDAPPDDGRDLDAAGAFRLGGASRRASVARADFGTITDRDERERLMDFADRLGTRMRYSISRRRRVDPKGDVLDLRRTLQRCIAHGAIPLKLFRREIKQPPVSLILFVDVSGSMDAYSLFFMRFVHALTGSFQQAQTFIFHTELVHVTGALRDADPVRMMEKMALMSQGWSGGTRIGDAIATFNRHYAKEMCSSRSIAIVLSDGYETGEAHVLDRELALLRRHCRKIVWLNPMLGRESYQPVTAGMEAARKHIDLFAAAHNLEKSRCPGGCSCPGLTIPCGHWSRHPPTSQRSSVTGTE